MLKILLPGLLFFSTNLLAQPSLELFPSLETIGVNVLFNNLSDPEKDLTATLEYRKSSATNWLPGFPPTPVFDKNRCTGSIFWLSPATTYEIRVQLNDPSTPGLNTLLTGETSTRPEADFSPSNSQLIVSPTGSGTLCSEAQPCGLVTALAIVQPGQDIELLGGTYFLGGLNLAKSGNAGAPITLRGRSGEMAVLDGRDPEPYTWQPANGLPGVFVTTLKDANFNVNCVTVDEVRLFPYRKLQPDLFQLQISCILLQPVPAGVGGMFRDPRPSTAIPFQLQNPAFKKLFVKLADGSDPSNHSVVVSLQKTGLTLENQSYIRFHNLIFQHYGVRPGGHAVRLKNCSEVIFDHCSFAHNDLNITVAGNSNRFTAQYCTFRDNTDWDTYIGKATYEPGSPFLCDGTLPDLYPFSDRVAEVGAIFFDHDYTGRGIVIRGNTFKGYMDGAHGGPPPSSPEQPMSREVDIFDNEFQGGDDGIELEGWAANLRFYRNILRDCGAAISLAPALTGPVYLLRNIISDFHETRSTIEGYADLVHFGGTPLKFQSGSSQKMGSIYVFHNTVCVKGTGKAYGLEVFPGAGSIEGFVAKNNIFYAEQNHALLLRGSESQLPSVDLDYNNYLNADTLIRVSGSTGTQYYLDLPAFRAASGYEIHGLNIDPLFTDTAANDYHLQVGSPCLDAGILIPGINDLAFSGTAPDIGAMETVFNTTNHPQVPAFAFQIYPNPAEDLLRFEPGTQGNWQATIYDALGRPMKQLADQSELQIGDWSPGIYFVRIWMAAGEIQSKFIKH